MSRALIVGGGHNGLVCACLLARSGVDVLVLEAADRPGGGARTDETVPGFRFDAHSVAHNIMRMTGIADDLRLGETGLEYLEMDPFAVAVFADGRRVRFHRSVERTVASIAEVDREQACAYAAFMADALPLVDVLTAGLRPGRAALGRLARRAPAALGVVRRGGLGLAADLLGSYGRLLESVLEGDLTRGPVAAFAAHAGAGPDAAGGALFGLWQAAYHRFGQWHAAGGAEALARALVARLELSGGRVRCDAPVRRIVRDADAVRAVELETGERLSADVVVTAIDPRAALLGLLDPPLGGRAGTRLRATRRGNAVQAVAHVAVDRLPAYDGARPGDWNGLQSFVDTLDDLRAGFAAAQARRLPDAPAPAYAFTTSALDASLAPPGCHTLYLACPCAPYAIAGGWDAAAPRLLDDLLGQVERRAPGFRATIVDARLQTPAAMAGRLRWPGAHPMHLDPSLDQLGPLRPTPALAGHRTPVAGLYVTGAGTAPVGGIAGAPGRAAARAVLADLGRRRPVSGGRARRGRAR